MPLKPTTADESTSEERAASSPTVLLVHGIWNAKAWLAPFALRLRREGLAPSLFGYASVLGEPERAQDRLIAYLRRHPVERLVGHSLGGLVILEALRRAPDLQVKRVVCLGSPLRGSAVAGAIGERPPLSLLLGRSRRILKTGCPPWGGTAEVGVVAGDRPRGVGGWFAEMQAASDGTVNLDETRLDGLADHCTVPASHSGLVMSADAARQTAAFLQRGRFDR